MSKFYIAIDFFGWAQGDTCHEAIRKREEDSGKKMWLQVFEVEGDPKMTYSINWFVPHILNCRQVYTRDCDREGNIIEESFHSNRFVRKNEKGQWAVFETLENEK